MSRPQTIREMQSEKKGRITKASITVLNISNQLIKIHLDPPTIKGKKLDFYVAAQDFNLTPGQKYEFPANRIRMEQVLRLQKMQKVSIINENKGE